MTTSNPCTAQSVTAVRIADATEIARAQATSGPAISHAAADSAARSDADCARWRVVTADPSTATPAVTATSSATMATATRVAEPVSSATRLGHRDSLGGDGDPRQQRRSGADPGHQQLTVATHRDQRPGRADTPRRRHTVIAAGSQPGRLPGGVDAPDLQHHGIEPGQTQHQDRYQRGDRERRLDGDGSGVIAQTLVFNARLMMLDNALTIESPVTTV